ncbi:YjbF family lipoprotein [Pseudoroseicyclus aestuarii]|uniref:Group 4 capsule polysaccharide lipoprotein GfcB/YjbF n=1 Tax=Pseudoroseicyclus aestuarii TaxID=1795041 RepID=A0A318SQG7_9RHOB|nr:YjbF family lipoprotein [Pseudoroseicyclus aestuarii]PYE83665.1 group 4 capsule polysaccharide lipoprotein GfcB/YjbF [Pseudoroseicyclus aestuarii]
MTRITIPALLALTTLAACGQGEAPGLFGQIAGRVGPLLVGRGPLEVASGEAAATLPGVPEGQAPDPESLLAVEARTLGIVEAAVKVQDNGDRETFIGQSGYSLAYEDGILVATRGLLDDLMGADTGQVRAALNAGGGRALRVHDRLSDLDQIIRAEFDCVIAPAGNEAVELLGRTVTARKFSESCEGESVAFQNLYWLDQDGTILTSRQYVTPTVAYLRSTRP